MTVSELKLNSERKFNMHSNNMQDMLNDGFSRKFALYYLQLLEAENNSPYFDREYAEWAHSMGFLAHNACVYGLSPENVNDYLSDYDYYKIWPINSWSKIWIDDKLTLKYILSGTEFEDMMPEYYYYSTPTSGEGGLRTLMNNTHKGQDITNFIDLLKDKKALACKPNNSSASQGFVKLSFDSGFFIDDKPATAKEIAGFVYEHGNYIFTEYLEPSELFSKIFPQIHTLRIVTINEHGNDPYIAAAYMRFPNRTSGSANYNITYDDAKYNLVTDVDVVSGFFGETKIVFADHVRTTKIHPDTGIEIVTPISLWKGRLKERILGIAELLSNVEYMGFDVGITSKGAKIMEINSHPGIGYLQCFRAFYTDEKLNRFFRGKIQKVKTGLSENEH